VTKPKNPQLRLEEKPERGGLPTGQDPSAATLPAGTRALAPLSAAAEEFSLLQRKAKAYAESTIVPDRFQGKVANCIIAIDMAQRLGASALAVMQNLYVVYGNPGWSAKFLIASFNECGRFSAIKYEWKGDRGDETEPPRSYGCRAYATEKATGERVNGPWVTFGMVKDEGWWDRKDRDGKLCSKWRTLEELMFMYRAGSYLVKTAAPEISMGLGTAEEAEDAVIDLEPGAGGTFSAQRGTENVTRDLRRKYAGCAECGAPADSPHLADCPTPRTVLDSQREPGDETEIPPPCCPGAPHQHVEGCPNA